MSAKESRADKDKRTVGFRVRDGKRGWMRSAVSGDPIQCGAYPEPVAMAVARDVIVASRSTTARLIRVLRARPSVALANAVKERDAACIRTTVVEARVRVVECERDKMTRLFEHWRERWHREVGAVGGERDASRARVRVVESERDALRGERDEALATRRQYEAELRHYSTTGRSEKNWVETKSEQELFDTEARRAAAQRGWESASEALLQANAVNSVIRNSLTRAEARVGALRAALIATINACPGAGATDDVSDDFLVRAPDEVRGQMEGLARERDEARDSLDASRELREVWTGHYNALEKDRDQWRCAALAAECAAKPGEAGPNPSAIPNSSPLAPSPSPIAPPSAESASPDDAGAAGASAGWATEDAIGRIFRTARWPRVGYVNVDEESVALARGIRAVFWALDAAKVRT